jgi:hypothetical protein
MIKIKSFLFHTGYVESQSLACLMLTHEKGFDSVQEALNDIDRLLREAVSISELPKCCRATQAKDEDANFCKKCGTNLELARLKLKVDTGSMLSEHFNATCNDAEYWDAFAEAGWSHLAEHFDWPNHVLVEYAETVIPESTTKAWDKKGKPPDGGCWKTTAEYASYHVQFFNKKMKNQLLR